LPALDVQIEAYERRLIMAALEDSRGSLAKTMEVLGLPRRTLNEKMRRYASSGPRASRAGPRIEAIGFRSSAPEISINWSSTSFLL
jgi:DNA-binding Lrp family transcriptional regulator